MRRLELIADCGSCAGLCCELTSFEASEDFAFDKPAGERCRHLTADARCTVHARRAERGMRGCLQYECYGAGPLATRLLQAEPLAVRVEGFRKLRVLTELAWLLTGAQALCPGGMSELRGELAAALDAVETAAAADSGGLLALELSPLERRVEGLLRRVGVELGGRAGHS